MNKLPYIISLLFFILLATFCDGIFIINKEEVSQAPDNAEKITITQGVWGNVWFWEGDFMPVEPTGQIKPVERDIYVFKATKGEMVMPVHTGPFYEEVYSDLITIVQSDHSGFYQVELDTGLYSFFVKEDSLFYANLFDSEGFIQSARVFPDSVTELQIDITYLATF